MGIFQKLRMLMESNVNDVIARAENPEKMLNQIILEMREQLTKAKQEVALAIVEERKLKGQAEEEMKQAGEWERRAMLAVNNERDDMARVALARQQEYAQRATTLHATWQRHAAETEKLKDALRQLNMKIEEATRKKTLLIAQQRRAEAQRRIHETMSGLSDSSAFDAFNRMAEKIQHNERLALASVEVSEEISGDPAEREFKKLEASTAGYDMDDKLIALKRQMGVLPPPAAAPEVQRLGSGTPADATRAPAQPTATTSDAALLEEFDLLEQRESNRGGG